MSGTVSFNVATESQLNAAISAIDNGGTASASNTAYLIVLSADLTLASNIAAINLASGDTLTIEGLNYGNDNYTAQLDGNGSYRGFEVNAGAVILTNLSLTGMSAPGGTGGSPGGGGALYVGANASVATSTVSFSGDSARGGTPAGGAVFVAQGGSLDVSGGSVAGSGSAAGNGIFIQGNDSVTLTNTTVTGVIADQTGAHLGAGAGSVVTQGTVTLGGANQYTGGTQINGTLALTATGAAGSGAISFAATSGETLSIGAGAAPANQIDGFVPNAGTGLANTDVIDLVGVGGPASATLSAGNHLTVTGAGGAVTLNLDPGQNYAADTFVLAADTAGTGTAVTVMQSGFQVASEADLNAAIQAIDASGEWSASNIAYTITLTAGFALSTDLLAVNLAAGDTLTINGGGNTIDGAGTYRGFFDYAGGLTLENLTIQNAVASGGAGGSGLTPGGGGAGLGGGLFVASGGAATLNNVTFLNDGAIGGTGGAIGVGGTGGGGGLGGSGGNATTKLDGGGGGIGLTAIGGGGGGTGGPGIVPGVTSGGGKGGYVVVTHTGGSGKGGGGSRTITTYYPGSIGGIAGFGGGSASAKATGLGGGGANGAGGWGGGGSGAHGGGFGGGGGVANGAGGGLGAGGDIFVQAGGSLTITAGSLTGGAATGGTGGEGGGTGLGLGDGIFDQGGGVILAPASGQILSIADVIADPTGSGGTGAASLTMNGPGTVALSAPNSYSGGTAINGGTLSLRAAGAGGGGMISFGYGTAATLIVGAGDVPANVISGFLPGDVIDLQGIGTATGATPDANNVLTISGGTTPVQLALDPAQNLTGESFIVASDNQGGTLLTATDVNGDTPPAIFGTGTVTGDDHTPFNPFAAVTVADVDAGQTETVSVTQSAPANGTFSNLAGGTYDPINGVYTVSGDPAAVTAALQGLVFTPAINEVAPGQVVTTAFALSATDGLMTSIATTETAHVTALNDPPVITTPNWVYGYWNVPLNPFAGATVTDPDVGAAETVSFTVSSTWLGWGDINGLLSLGASAPAGFTLTHTGNGTYSLSGGTSPAQVTAAIEAVRFTPTPYPNDTGDTIDQIGVTVSDGIAAPVVAVANVQAGLPIFTGIAADQPVTDGQTIDPFGAVTVTDSAGLTIEAMTIYLYGVSPLDQYTPATDVNGTLSGAGLTQTGTGTYSLTPGTPQQITAELDSLVFTPALSNSPAITWFALQAFDGGTTVTNYDTSVIAAPGAVVPVISGTVGGQSTMDNATIDPFASVAITDANTAPSDAATISLIDASSGITSDANGTLSGAGLTETSPGSGVYVLAATDPGTLSAELDALVFTPTLNEAPPGYGITTTFALAVTDQFGTVNDQTTNVMAIPSAVQPVINGTAYGQLVADGATIDPFSAVTIDDANPAPLDSVGITVDDISQWFMIPTATDADGTLSLSGGFPAANLTHTGAGTYFLAASDPATISAELQALVFTPTPGIVSGSATITTDFTLAVADGLAVATDYNTSVITTANAPPTITLDPVAGTNAVDAADAVGGFAITGTTTGVEDGQTVWVLISGFAFSATVTGGTWSAAITPDQALALGDGSFTAYVYATDLAGITTQTVSENFTVDLAGAVAASPLITPTAIAFGATRVGGAAVARSLTVGNGATANQDQSALSYAVGTLPALVSGDTTSSGTLASGTSTPVNLTMNTNVAGSFSGTPVSVALTSLAPAGSGLTDAALPSGTLTLSGKVYAQAVAQLSATAVNFGVVHVGDAVSQALAVTNAATGALTDVLTGGFGQVSGGFTGTGTLGSGLASGASGSLTIGLKTTSSGTFSGSAALNLASHDGDLANVGVAAGPVALSGTVDNYAVAGLKKLSGTGTLTQSGTSYQLNLGTLATNSSAAKVVLGAYNAASGLADLLSGGFTVAAGSGFTNTGFAAFSGLGSGQTDSAPTVTLATTTAGTFSETVTLNPTGSNASGYSAALPAETLTITGTVGTPVYTLTTGTDTVKAGSGDCIIVAASNTLSSGDSITGGSGTTTLELTGGGIFNLTSPSTLSSIQTITAQEAQGTAAQTITLRGGLNATVNVAPDTTDASPGGIAIIGASNSDVINLGNGNDVVTMGAGETVNDGGGNNIFNVTAATIKATINGGLGNDKLVVTGGGTVVMGSAIKGIAMVSLAAPTTFTANATIGMQILGSTAGGDSITLGATGQSVTAGGANETIKASAAYAGGQVIDTGANGTLEITSGGGVTLNPSTSVATVKLDQPAMLQLNGMAFVTAVGSGTGGDTITAGGVNQTLTGGKADTFVGYAGGKDSFVDKASALNGDTIRGFLPSDAIDVTDLAVSGATLTVTPGTQNTVVKATSGSTTTSFTLAGVFSASGFQLASDGKTGTIITHG